MIDKLRACTSVCKGPTGAGVYLLFIGKRLLYVGKSKRLQQRLQHHLFKGSYGFDNYLFISTEHGEEDYVERILLTALRPKYNAKHCRPMTDKEWEHHSDVADKYGVSWLHDACMAKRRESVGLWD